MDESVEGIQEFNVLNHQLVPVHEVMSDEEAKQLLDDLDVAEEQLPKILVGDRAARACGAKPGQILRIRRKSRTAGESIAYRLVIEYQV
jgi:DNA-directed RNA polymerase subunit H